MYHVIFQKVASELKHSTSLLLFKAATSFPGFQSNCREHLTEEKHGCFHEFIIPAFPKCFQKYFWSTAQLHLFSLQDTILAKNRQVRGHGNFALIIFFQPCLKLPLPLSPKTISFKGKAKSCLAYGSQIFILSLAISVIKNLVYFQRSVFQ